MQVGVAAEAGGRAPWELGPGAVMLAAELHALGINSHMVRVRSEMGTLRTVTWW